jgi:hypothetical protein
MSRSADTVAAAILSGDARQEIQNAIRQLGIKQGLIEQRRQAAAAMPAGPNKDAAMAGVQAALQACLAEQQATYAARDKYNEIIEQIRTYSFGTVDPGLAGLGVAPVVTAAILVALLGAACLALGYLLDKITPLAAETNRAIQNIGGVVESAGDNTWKIALGLAIAVGVYWVFKNYVMDKKPPKLAPVGGKA